MKVSAIDPRAGAPDHIYSLRINLFAQDTPTPRPAPLPAYVPLAVRNLSRDAFRPPAATPTPEPPPDCSLFKAYGHVREGSETAPGLPGVEVDVSLAGTCITDAEGYYETAVSCWQNEDCTVQPGTDGYRFVPEVSWGHHWAYGGRESHQIDFVALPATVTATATPRVTPTPPLPSDIVRAVSVDTTTGDTWFGSDRGVGRLLSDGPG